jgi:CRP-like cAMP-binding protein
MAIAQNHLIERLPPVARKRLLAACESMPLRPGQSLFKSGARLGFACFPDSGVVSLGIQVDHHPLLEVGMVGREGMLGAHLALGVAVTPVSAVVQGEGAGWRIGAADLRRELARSPSLVRAVDAYLGVMLEQFASAVACRRFHEIEPRLARWLLMSQDRLHSPSFHVTHEMLAQMLGVRRVGVTVAAGSLQRGGLIGYHRGEVTVLNRPGLEAVACSCFATDRRAYQARLG